MLGKRFGVKDLLHMIKFKINLNCKICGESINPSDDSYHFVEHTFFIKGKEMDSDGIFTHENCYGVWKD